MRISIDKFRLRLGRLSFALVVFISIARLLSFFHEYISSEIYFNMTLFGVVVAIAYMCFAWMDWQLGSCVTLNKTSLISLVLFGFMALSVLLQNIFIRDLVDYESRSALRQSFLIFIFAAIYFFLGSAIRYLSVNRTSVLISILLLGLLLFEIGSSLNDGLVLNFNLLAQSRSTEVKFDHLTIGEPAAILIFLSLSFAPRSIKYLLFLIGAACLFALGGRTALLVYMLTWFIYKIICREKIFLISLDVVALVTIAVIFYNILGGVDDDLVGRMLFSEGLDQDFSNIERNEYFHGGLRALPDQMPIGDPTFLVRKYNYTGSYIHNIFSAWQYYGFIVFVGLVFAIFYVWKYISINIKSLDGVLDEFAIRLFVFSALSLMVGKSINFGLIWLSLGYWLGCKRVSRETPSAGLINYCAK